ncbi:MAG TPA: hypothetical protein VJQ79_14755, partial [Acidimicrobiia bacterium]|nr:hypothetical protein [Acidimicrobiia bacterium]
MLAVALSVGLLAGSATAITTPAAEFEVEGDLTTGTETLAGLDWSESDVDEDDGALTFDDTDPVDPLGSNPTDNPNTPGTATFFRDDLKLGGDSTTFTQGAKQNDVTSAQTGTETLTSLTNYPVVSGSIPPNKVDLFDVLTYTFISGSDAEGVIGLVRTEDNGSANYSIEINAVGFETCPPTTGTTCALTRTEGDILINADITQGGVVGEIRMFRWDLPGGIDGGGEDRGTSAGGVTGANCAGNLTGSNPTKACPWEEIAVPASLFGVLNQVEVDAGEWGS